MTHIEAQLHRRCELVDILPTRARGADELFFQLPLVDADPIVDFESCTMNVSRCWTTGKLYGLSKTITLEMNALTSRRRTRPHVLASALKSSRR